MAAPDCSTSSSIQNRSPFVVTVRSDASLNRRFVYSRRAEAATYLKLLKARGVKARLEQLETAFQLRIRRKGVPNQYVTFDTLEDAQQAKLQIEADLSVSVVRDYAIATRTTLRELMERYLTEVVPSHKGADIEATRIRRLLRDEAFVDKKLAALVTEDLQDYIQDRLTEVAPATVDRELDLISQTLSYADDVWKIAPVESPFAGLRRPKYFNERDRRLLPEEERVILTAAREDANPYIEPVIILALETAMRRGELLGLKLSDVHFAGRYLFLPDTKNGRSRKVPLSKRAETVIRALIEQRSLHGVPEDDDRLLPLTTNAFKKAFFERVLPRSGVNDLHFHDLRHEAISRFAESGQFSLLELQAISGHRDVRMLQRYAHLLAGNLAVKMDAISGYTDSYVHRGRRRRVVTEGSAPIVAATPGPLVEVALSRAVEESPAAACRQTPAKVIDFQSVRRQQRGL